ncbi:MAG: sigma-54 dependent transcriptional regulator [Bacteroidales bacterium]|nr:sigma-54 dependent transcriptional regulator [Bacteroidales bacterium]
MRIYVIEDDRIFNRLIVRALDKDKEVEIVSFFNGTDFLERLSDNPEVVTLDLGLPDYSGAYLLRQIKQACPETEVIIISGQDDLKLAVQLLKEGAYDYIAKDENIRERLIHCIHHIRGQQNLKNELRQLKSEISVKYNYLQAIIGESEGMKTVLSLIDKAVKVSNVSVSITGEAGTGKELVAKAIHYNSARRHKPFVIVNVGAIPYEMLEGELFGFEKGVLDGGRLRHKGKIEEAAEGTLYIEDVDLLGPDLQVKLFQFLQSGNVRRIGGEKDLPVNTRVISGATIDLLEAVRRKQFRDDLYFRLMGIPIHLPSLQERQKDVVLLAQFFLRHFCEENGIERIELTLAARRKLLDYPFPGNVRELKAVVELAAVLTNTSLITEAHIVFNGAGAAPDLLTEEMSLKAYNEKIIRHYLDKYQNVVLVAEKLDVGKSTIYNLIKKWSKL